MQTTKAVPLAPGHTEIYYPGEIEDRKLVAAHESGILLPDKTVRELHALADACGLEVEDL